jgi:hypothetical protein
LEVYGADTKGTELASYSFEVRTLYEFFAWTEEKTTWLAGDKHWQPITFTVKFQIYAIANNQLMFDMFHSAVGVR